MGTTTPGPVPPAMLASTSYVNIRSRVSRGVFHHEPLRVGLRVLRSYSRATCPRASRLLVL
jgi:hypothetical protein